MLWLALPFPILATLTTLAFGLRTTRMRRLQAVADSADLVFQRSYLKPWTLKGDFRGRALTMSPTSHHGRAGKRHRTLVVLDVKNPEFLRLRMRRQDRIRHPFRIAEFEVGDSRFDGRYFIQSDEPVLVRDLIQQDNLRDVLIRSEIYSAEVLGPKLQVVYDGRLEDPAQAGLVFTAATTLADAIDGLTRDAPLDQKSV